MGWITCIFFIIIAIFTEILPCALYYMTQASTKPPTFVTFCNNKELFHYSYQRYLENQIREAFSLDATPIKMVVRERGEDK